MKHPTTLRTARTHPREAGDWPLNAARDFSTASHFLSNSKQSKRLSVDHLACLLGAVISYARPFTEPSMTALNQQPHQRNCFLEIATDLGADIRLHAALLLARDEIVSLSDAFDGATARGLKAAGRRLRSFSFPNPRAVGVVSRIDLAAFSRIAMLMRLACIFFLAEVTMGADSDDSDD
jgi:hypothetical protein